jgi:hypothetical protein
MKSRGLVTWCLALLIVITCYLILVNSSAPHLYRIELASVSSEQKKCIVKSPPRAWFSALHLIVKGGTIPKDSLVQIAVKFKGEQVFSKGYPGEDMIKSDPFLKESFRISLKEAFNGKSVNEELGYGAEYEVTVRAEKMEGVKASLWAHYIDDRAFRIPDSNITVVRLKANP